MSSATTWNMDKCKILLFDSFNTFVIWYLQYFDVSSTYSRSPQVTKWLAIKEKVLKQSSEKKSNFADAALELMRFKRKEKAADFVTHVKMAWAYRCSSKFMGVYALTPNKCWLCLTLSHTIPVFMFLG